MTQKSAPNDRERLDPSGEIRPGFLEPVVYKSYLIRSQRLPLRWGWLLFSSFLSFAPALPSHCVPAALTRGAFETQAHLDPSAKGFVVTQALVAAQEGPTFPLGVNSSQAMDLVESEQIDAPTEEGTDTHGATDDDGDDDEDDDGDDDDGAGLSTDAPLVEHAKINIRSLSPEHILAL